MQILPEYFPQQQYRVMSQLDEVSEVVGAGVAGVAGAGAGVVGAGVAGAGVVGAGVAGAGVVGAGVETTASNTVSVVIVICGVTIVQVKLAFQSEFKSTVTKCLVESRDMFLMNFVSVRLGPFNEVLKLRNMFREKLT